MSVILKADSFTVPESSGLNMRGLQTDQYNTVLGGHKAIFDPIQQGIAGIVSGNQSISNLVYGKPSATAGAIGLPTETVESAKGFPFASNLSNETILLPKESFNLLQLGLEPSVVISIWLTSRSFGTLQGIAGCSYQSSTYSQWAIYSASVAGQITISAQGQGTNITPVLNVPELYTIYAKRVSAGNMEIYLAKDGAIVSKKTSTYPFKNPEAGGSVSYGQPIMGITNGFANQWNGIIHRIQCFKVDPATFDFEQWLVDEVAGNTGRFDLP